MIAQWQHIVYKEWLPILLDSPFMNKTGLLPLPSGFSSEKRRTWPKIPEKNSCRGNIGDSDGLKNVFKQGGILIIKEDFIENIIRGLASDKMQTLEGSFVEDIIKNLFEDDQKCVAYEIQGRRQFCLVFQNTIFQYFEGILKTWSCL